MNDKILYIDDEQDFLGSITSILSRKGFEVFPASSGEEGLAILEKEKIQVVISDYKMPGMSGTEVLKKAKEYDPDVCVVLASAYPSTKNTLEALKYGAFDYLVKPYKLDELLDVIKRGLQNRSVSIKNRQIIETANLQVVPNQKKVQALNVNLDVTEQFEVAGSLIKDIVGRWISLDCSIISSAVLLSGGVEALEKFALSYQVVSNQKRKTGSEDGDCITAAILANATNQNLTLFSHEYDAISSAKGKKGSADGHGVNAAILAIGGEPAFRLFTDSAYEAIPVGVGSYDGDATTAALLALGGLEAVRLFKSAKEKIDLVKRKVGTEDGDNIAGALLAISGEQSYDFYESAYNMVVEVKRKQGRWDNAGIEAALLAQAKSNKVIADFKTIFTRIVKKEGNIDSYAIAATRLALLQNNVRSSGFAEGWLLTRN